MEMAFVSKITFKGLLLIIVTSTIISSCIQSQKFPDEPQIEFVAYTFTDSMDLLSNVTHLGLLTISFTDGDGDIGLYQSETQYPYDFNIFIYRIGISAGAPVLTDMDTLNFRIPYLTPESQNKTLRGEIDIDINLYKDQIPKYPYDTMYYELYIKDRALHVSNIITTPEIVL